MSKYLHNIVYKTTNTVNNKIYIGVHSTNNLNDGYLGSGKTLKLAFKKYGIKNFKRDILFDVENTELAYFIEYFLVNDKFINRKDTYNLVVGGSGLGASYLEDYKYTKELIKIAKNLIKRTFLWI